MSTVPTRRQVLLGTAAFSLGLGGVLLPESAYACHRYVSPVDGRVGCGGYKRDRKNGVSSDSGSTSTVSQPSSTDTSSTDTSTQSGSGDPQVSGQTIRVSNGPQLENALGIAKPGNRIELADGSYRGNFLITVSGTSSAPILIEASNRLRAELQAPLVLRGNHVVVSGLSFRGAGVLLRAANLRVTRCYFNGGRTPISARGSDKAEIDHNEMTGWTSTCIHVDPEEERRSSFNHHIYRNYLHDSVGSNRNNGIIIGDNGSHHKINVNALVEYNLFENINPGVTTVAKPLSTKSSGNTIRYNTLINSQGITNRWGRDNKYIGNWLENCNSFRITDEKVLVEGNKLINVRLGLIVLAGNERSDDTRRGGYPFSDSCQLIRNDTSGITIGRTYGGWDRIYPAVNTILSGNTGKISLSRQTGTQVSSSGQSEAGKAAVKLRPSDVGPWS